VDRVAGLVHAGEVSAASGQQQEISLASTVFDSALFRDMFGTAEMREVFSDEALVGRYLEAEAALARAQARAGVVSQEAAQAIDAAARSLKVDYDKLRQETEIVGYPILPLVHQLSAAAGDAGRFVHWGATTQDIMDTANVLQIRAALAIVERDLKEIGGILAGMARKYRDTPMAGRTHLQQALPVTFGYKAAVWLSSIDRHLERLAQIFRRGGYAGVGRRGRAGNAKAVLRGTGPKAAIDRLACGARRHRGSRRFAWPDHRHARQDRNRRHDDVGDRIRRAVGAVRARTRRFLDHAAKAQPDLERVDAGGGKGRPPARRHHARRHDP
jgi:hypothetical protein